MDKDYFEKYFYYDETSPTCLRWKIHNSQRNHSERQADEVAGHISTPDLTNLNYKRYKVCVENREYLVHRVILILHGFEIDDLTVNHVNCNPLDNRIENLELCTGRENNLRKKSHTQGIMQSNNTSGFLGVRETVVIRPSGRVDKYAHAYVKNMGKCKQKKFNYKTHGKEKAWELAIQWREEMFRRTL